MQKIENNETLLPAISGLVQFQFLMQHTAPYMDKTACVIDDTHIFSVSLLSCPIQPSYSPLRLRF